MTFKEIQNADLDTELTIMTELFTVHSRLEVQLEGGPTTYWLFSGSDLLLSLNPEADELFLFRRTEGEVEKDDDMVVEGGKDYEFSYEDRGAITSSEGLMVYNEGEVLEFADYESDDGSRVRLVTNTYDGEEEAFVGQVITEDDVVVNEA